MNVVGYLRVSTVEQLDGYGLQVQREAIERCADAHRLRVVDWFADEGVSGTIEATDRDGLAGALDAIERGAGGLIVAKLDRLARALTVQEAALAHVWRADGRVWAADGGEVLQDDPDDPMRKAMRQMAGVFAELERSMIAKRMRDGARAKRAAGGYAGGRPSYGRCADGRGDLVVDADEAVTVALILQLRQGGASLRQVAAELEGRGVLTKTGGGRWHPHTIARIERANTSLDVDRVS